MNFPLTISLHHLVNGGDGNHVPGLPDCDAFDMPRPCVKRRRLLAGEVVLLINADDAVKASADMIDAAFNDGRAMPMRAIPETIDRRRSWKRHAGSRHQLIELFLRLAVAGRIGLAVG